MSFLVATNVIASRPTDWNAARLCQKLFYSLNKAPFLGQIQPVVDINTAFSKTKFVREVINKWKTTNS